MTKDMGISRQEIEAIQAIVMAVAAGQVRAQFRDARAQAHRKKPTAE